MTDDELIRHLQNLPREATPPGGVRHVVARAARGSIARRRSLYWQLAAAASLFIVAFVLGRSTAPRATSVRPSHRFVLLLYGGEASASPDDRVGEYAAWASRIRSDGRRVSGERLADESWTIGAPSDNLPLRGFFVIQARDDQDARALAEAHPHVRYGGGIVVRPIADTP